MLFRSGSLPSQREVTGRLDGIALAARAAALPAPALIVIGAVAALAAPRQELLRHAA